MKVYLVRHGEYDSNYELSNVGKQQIEETAKQLNEELNGLQKIVVYHSRLPRAAQSAEVLAANLEADAELVESPELECDSYRADKLIQRLDSDAIFVGHKPDLSALMRQHDVHGSLGYGWWSVVEVD